MSIPGVTFIPVADFSTKLSETHRKMTHPRVRA